MFRLDGGGTTYVFGVNERGELQALYWGGKLEPSDKSAAAHSMPEVASFDSPGTTTPQEYASWGAGLFTEPALKVTFADGNRDLVVGSGRQRLQQCSQQILVIARCRKPVLCRERRDRCPGTPAHDPINLAGAEAVVGQQQLHGARFEIR